MADTNAILGDFRKYGELIRDTLAKTQSLTLTLSPRDLREPQRERGQDIFVERGIVYPHVLVDPKSADLSPAELIIQRATSDRLASIPIIDQANHHRPVYTGLLIYSLLQTYRIAYEILPATTFSRWEEGLRPWCDMLESELTNIEWPEDGMPASRGANASEGVWMALALFVAGKVFVRDAWTDLASDTFGRLMRGDSNRRSFLVPTNADNPETLWYHELTILHAAASYAVQAEDRTLAAAVARNTEYHLAETQPDHATAQPWGLFAFIWNPKTRMVADQMLHTLAVQHPDSADGVTLMLLADTLYCLRLFVP
jgi:hypothetical protein